MVFDTIANEAQRLLFENFSMFIFKNGVAQYLHTNCRVNPRVSNQAHYTQDYAVVQSGVSGVH